MNFNKKLINKDLLNREYAWFAKTKIFNIEIKLLKDTWQFQLNINNDKEIVFTDKYPTLDTAYKFAELWIKNRKLRDSK